MEKQAGHDNWAWDAGILMENPWWFDDITPEEYEEERNYFRFHYEDWKQGKYRTLHQQEKYLHAPIDVIDEYGRITKKLGFDLRDGHPLPHTRECETAFESFSVLTEDEIAFLEQNRKYWENTKSH